MKSGVCLCVLLVSAAVWSSCGLQSGRERREAGRTSLGLSKRGWQAASRVHLPRDLVSRVSEGKGSFTYRLGAGFGRRRRGSGGEQKCGLSESTLLEHMPQSLTESAEAIQASWVGKDEILIVASDPSPGDRTTVWIGLPKTYGTFLFTSYSERIKGAVSPSSLQTSNAHRQTVVVVSTARDKLWVSRDAGRNWDNYKLPTTDFAAERDLYLSSIDPRHMVLLSKLSELYVSDNWGETWHVIVAGKGASGVQSAQLAVRNGKEYLYYSTGTSSSHFLPLYRMDIAQRRTEVIDNHAYRFSVDGKYLYVSRKNHSSNVVADLRSRRLYVSSNYDRESHEIVFKEVQLPSLKPEQYYVIMATHESGAFIHVARNTGNPYGELYVSDSSGSRFSLSLSSHLYKVIDLPYGIHFAIDDFYEVKSSRGVYITTSVTKDNDHVTMITYDNGGEWQRIRPPSSAAHCHFPTCSLHLHLHYSQMISRRYNISSLTGPLSVQSAPGIILAHGNVGAVRNSSKPQLYLSSDGGYTWTDPGLPQGTYAYGIADYGNIIFIAPDTEHVEFVWFSHNRGSCFVQEQIDSTSVFALTRGLLMDPSAASLFAFVMGVEGEGQDDEWRMITVNFGSLLSRECQPQDYYTVTEHVASSTCLLGYKSVYNITKPAAVCYNEKGYDYHPITTDDCTCTYTDYECDFGFIRDGDECKKDPQFNLAAVCPPGQSHYQESISGFRLIPGDRCKPTDETKDLLQQRTQPCTGHEQDSGIDSAGHSGRAHKGGSTAVRAVGAIAIIAAIVVAAGVCFYGYLRCKDTPKSNERVVYQKLPVSDARFSATEEDSDEDMIDAS